jgi:hypothetical protein
MPRHGNGILCTTPGSDKLTVRFTVRFAARGDSKTRLDRTGEEPDYFVGEHQLQQLIPGAALCRFSNGALPCGLYRGPCPCLAQQGRL